MHATLLSVDAWMDGWVDGWMDGWMDVDGWIQMDEQLLLSRLGHTWMDGLN
jgi:hypothetical protein